MAISPGQIRAARGLLNWSQSDLGQKCNLSTTSIGAIEKGETRARPNNIAAIQKAFEDGGLEFLPDEGIRKRVSEIRRFTGISGFDEFYEDVYETMRQNTGVVRVSNVDERVFEKWSTEELRKNHIKRIKDVSTYQILVREGDTHYVATSDYAEYRWMPKDAFASVAFYIYGDKVALMLFNEEPVIILLNYLEIAKVYREQFDAMWENAKIPNAQIRSA